MHIHWCAGAEHSVGLLDVGLWREIQTYEPNT